MKRVGTLAGLFVISAVLPYAYLLTTNLPSPVNFYGPLNSLDAPFHYVTREGYAATDHQQVSWFDKALYMKLVLTETVAQYGPVFLACAAGGFVLQWRRWPWSVCWALIVLYTSTTFLLVWLVDFKFTELWAGVFSIYPVIAWCAPALWGALALESAAAYLRGKIPPARRIYARGLGAALTALLVATVALANVGFNKPLG